LHFPYFSHTSKFFQVPVHPNSSSENVGIHLLFEPELCKFFPTHQTYDRGSSPKHSMTFGFVSEHGERIHRRDSPTVPPPACHTGQPAIVFGWVICQRVSPPSSSGGTFSRHFSSPQARHCGISKIIAHLTHMPCNPKSNSHKDEWNILKSPHKSPEFLILKKIGSNFFPPISQLMAKLD